jgi:hypothetical protein
MAPLRDRTFFSLAELNRAIGELVAELNGRPFQKLEGSRRSLFEELDRPALRPLPAERYQFAQWRKARVNIDYHIEVDHNYYSVPYTLVRKEVEVRLTLGTVEAFFRGRRVASHIRACGRGRFVTDEAHMPEAHRRQRDRTRSRLIAQADAIGPETGKLVRASRSKPPRGRVQVDPLGDLELGVVGTRDPRLRPGPVARRSPRAARRRPSTSWSWTRRPLWAPHRG